MLKLSTLSLKIKNLWHPQQKYWVKEFFSWTRWVTYWSAQHASSLTLFWKGYIEYTEHKHYAGTMMTDEGEKHSCTQNVKCAENQYGSQQESVRKREWEKFTFQSSLVHFVCVCCSMLKIIYDIFCKPGYKFSWVLFNENWQLSLPIGSLLLTIYPLLLLNYTFWYQLLVQNDRFNSSDLHHFITQ